MATFWDSADSLVTQGKEKKATKQSQAAIDELKKLQSPEFEEYDPELYSWLQDFNPELIDAGADVNYQDVNTALAGRSEMDNINLDPRLRDAQFNSLNALDEIAQGGGLTLADQANLNKVQSDVAQADRGRREAIMQGMRERGMGGSGMELLAMLDSSQAATDRASQSGMDIAGMAQQRALDAMIQGGNVAGGIRSQEFGEQADIAAANDAIARFNTANTNQTNQFNAGNRLNTDMYNRDTNINVAQTNANATNDARKFNVAGRQDTANTNVAGSNDAQMQNKFTAPQQTFQNNLAKAQGVAGANQAAANLNNEIAARRVKGTQDASKQTMQGIAMSDERVKKDVKHIAPEEISEFLQAIQPKNFKYKNPEKPGQAEGDRIGFLLQDVADTKLGKAITSKNEDGHLQYDKDNLNGIILAAMSMLAKGA